MKQVTLITDGSCIGNPGPGGWAFILRYGEYSKEQAGGCAETTNNRMEVQALAEGLKALKEPCEILLISDSQYLLNGVTNWRYKWRANGWIRRRKTKTYPLANSDLWKELDQLAERHIVRGHWIQGHSGHPDNERCDQLAAAQASLHVDVHSCSSLVDRAA
jgi:ribonuclease HI